MQLRRAYKKHRFVTNLALRTMGVKPERVLSDSVEETRAKIFDKIGQIQKAHPEDRHPPVVSQKEAESFFNANFWEETEADRMARTKPGDKERTAFYTKISEIQPDDHEVIKKVKKNIKKLLDQELEFLGFKEELKEAEANALIEETYKDVQEKKSFFYKYDANKVNTNKNIYDALAPGNEHRKINYILPHEHIHPQHHIDVANLTENDISDLYAYYTMYIDFHIGQIRRDVKEKSYIPPQFRQIAWSESSIRNSSIDNKFIEYYHHWREPTRTWRSQTQEIDFAREKEQLPVNKHPDSRAFSKNEVEWTEAQKFPHVANRLGYPEFGESPIERMFGIERAQAHPSYQLQAFVQTPSMDPDPALNFEIDETIYENKRVGEWVRMWKWIMFGVLPFWPAFYTFEIYQNDGVPSIQWLNDLGVSWQIPLQFQDSGNWNLEQIRYCDDHDYMNIHYMYKRAWLRPAHTFYQVATLALLYNLNFNYATKMVYNKDRDLVFVYKPDGMFTDKEYVYEVHHLESMVPGVVGAYQHLGVGHKDGITTLLCMDTKDLIKLYNDPRYWNLELRDDFLSQTRSMWSDLCDKYNGRVITIAHRPSKEHSKLAQRINKELDEAVEKHGVATPFHSYENQFKDKIERKRKEISEAAAE